MGGKWGKEGVESRISELEKVRNSQKSTQQRADFLRRFTCCAVPYTSTESSMAPESSCPAKNSEHVSPLVALYSKLSNKQTFGNFCYKVQDGSGIILAMAQFLKSLQFFYMINLAAI